MCPVRRWSGPSKALPLRRRPSEHPASSRTQCTTTALEASNDLSTIVPLMIGSFVAYYVARLFNHEAYDELLIKKKGVPFLDSEIVHVMDAFLVACELLSSAKRLHLQVVRWIGGLERSPGGESVGACCSSVHSKQCQQSVRVDSSGCASFRETIDDPRRHFAVNWDMHPK